MCVCVCVCVCVRARARVRACVRAGGRAGVHACACLVIRGNTTMLWVAMTAIYRHTSVSDPLTCSDVKKCLATYRAGDPMSRGFDLRTCSWVFF